MRTNHMLNQQFSYVSNAAVSFGDDAIGVVDDGSYFIYGILKSQLPAQLGKFYITKSEEEVCKGKNEDRSDKVINFEVSLLGKDENQIKVDSNMLLVNVLGSHENFQSSVGLMVTRGK